MIKCYDMGPNKYEWQRYYVWFPKCITNPTKGKYCWVWRDYVERKKEASWGEEFYIYRMIED